MSLTTMQRAALIQLAEAYGNLSSVWSSEWEGPENFGGTLAELGLLPYCSLDEAEGNLMHLLEEVPRLVSCKPCGGSGDSNGEKCDICSGSGLVSEGETGSEELYEGENCDCRSYIPNP